MPRRARPAALVAVAVCSWIPIGCSDDAEPSHEESAQSVDDVAAGWGEIAPPEERRTRSYLAGDGASLMEYADLAASLDLRLDDAAYADRCAELRAGWADSYPRRATLDWLSGLPDPILGRLWSSQVPAFESALAACADGDRERGAEAAEQVTVLQQLVDRRLDQLGVDR